MNTSSSPPEWKHTRTGCSHRINLARSHFQHETYSLNVISTTAMHSANNILDVCKML